MALKEFNLEGKVAIVTGGSRGIGKGIALTLAEAGADIVVAARSQAPLEQVAQEIRGLGRRALAVPTDVTRANQIERLVEGAIEAFGRIDVLVNNAGRSAPKPLVPLGQKTIYSELVPGFDTLITEAEWHEQIDMNLTSAFLVTRAVGPYMIKERKGKIINITSNQSTKPFLYHIAYGSAKAGLNMFTKGLALEWAKFNIHVNAIGSGLANTELGRMYVENEKLREATLRAIPLRRLTDPRDIGLLAVYFASDASDNVTGQIIYCDGGMVIT
ncbi:MAG: SDR family oxidoreductase [Proteobacteria bacterium]|nr:SDR family oxidoreductase [Pseudomonadota bacterium]